MTRSDGVKHRLASGIRVPQQSVRCQGITHAIRTKRTDVSGTDTWKLVEMEEASP
jgi:hypothetical protein